MIQKEYPYNVIDVVRARCNIEGEYPKDVEDAFNYLMSIMDPVRRSVIEYRYRDRLTQHVISSKIRKSGSRVGQLEELALTFLSNNSQYIQYGLKGVKDKNVEMIDRNETIEKLGLSKRGLNSLHAYGYKTINDLVNGYNNFELYRIKNLGKKTYSEIESRLFRYGLIDELKSTEFVSDRKVTDLGITYKSRYALYNNDIYYSGDILRFIRMHCNDCTTLKTIIGIDESDYVILINRLRRLGNTINDDILSE